MDMDAITNLLISLVAGLAGVVLILLRADIKQIGVELNGFRAELNGFRAEMNGRFDAVLATQKQHGERLAKLETLVTFLIGPRSGGVPDPENVEPAMVAFRTPGTDEAEQA